jgi:hypothetical protein
MSSSGMLGGVALVKTDVSGVTYRLHHQEDRNVISSLCASELVTGDAVPISPTHWIPYMKSAIVIYCFCLFLRISLLLALVNNLLHHPLL